MPIYKLAPVEAERDHESWDATYLKEACWIEARSVDEARWEVDTASTQMVDHEKYPNGAPNSPWRDHSLTTCVVDDPDFKVPPGTIILSNGKPYR